LTNEKRQPFLESWDWHNNFNFDRISGVCAYSKCISLIPT